MWGWIGGRGWSGEWRKPKGCSEGGGAGGGGACLPGPNDLAPHSVCNNISRWSAQTTYPAPSPFIRSEAQQRSERASCTRFLNSRCQNLRAAVSSKLAKQTSWTLPAFPEARDKVYLGHLGSKNPSLASSGDGRGGAGRGVHLSRGLCPLESHFHASQLCKIASQPFFFKVQLQVSRDLTGEYSRHLAPASWRSPQVRPPDSSRKDRGPLEPGRGHSINFLCNPPKDFVHQ